MAAGQSADHDSNHCPADHGLGTGGEPHVAAREAPMHGHPREGALDGPALGPDLEPALVRRLAHDLQLAAEDRPRPVH